jgi:hypothetical protein
MEKCSCGFCPTIIIPGIGQSKVDLYSEDNQRIKCAWPLDIDSKAFVKQLIPSGLKLLITKNDKSFCKNLKKAVKEAVKIPVFANGDVVSIETAEQWLEESQADGVAIGRGVLGDPTLIARVEKYFHTGEYLPPPTLEEKIAGMRDYLYREIEFRGEDVGIKFVRKFYPYYINGFSGASRYRGELVLLDNLKDINKMLDEIALQSSKKMLV